MQEITAAKKIKIPNEIPSASQMNLDSSSGLYITSELRQSARIVAVNKEKINKEKEVRKAEILIKNAISSNKRQIVYSNIIDTIWSTNGGILLGVQNIRQQRISSWLTSILTVNWFIYQTSDR